MSCYVVSDLTISAIVAAMADTDYTEDFRSIAKRELKGKNLKIVLSSLADQA